MASQGAANEWQVFRDRLTDPNVLVGNRFAGTPWNASVMGPSLTPGTGPVGSTVQMDWVRYYTLDRPNAKSIQAPEMTSGTYADAC